MHAARRIAVLAFTFLLVAGAQAAGTGTGVAAPDFALPARDGTTVHLSSLKGQVVMLNFWATWCGPCRQEMPLLAKLQDKYEPLGFTLLGVNIEPDSSGAETWLKGMAINFPILFDRENAVASHFALQGMPSSVFIDRTGVVRYVHEGYRPGDESKYADMIRSLVKE
jgi:peroxiredoxin